MGIRTRRILVPWSCRPAPAVPGTEMSPRHHQAPRTRPGSDPGGTRQVVPAEGSLTLEVLDAPVTSPSTGPPFFRRRSGQSPRSIPTHRFGVGHVALGAGAAQPGFRPGRADPVSQPAEPALRAGTHRPERDAAVAAGDPAAPTRAGTPIAAGG